MHPVGFKQQNCTHAKKQPEYLTLPSHKDKDGIVTTCWRLSFIERMKILALGRIWWQTMTFNCPLQPQKPSAENPIKSKEQRNDDNKESQ